MTQYFFYIILGTVLVSAPAYAKKDSAAVQSPYTMYPKIELPTTAIGIGGALYGFNRLGTQTRLEQSFVQQLTPEDVNSFDRRVLRHGETGYKNARNKSDWIRNLTIGAPTLLLLDKRIGSDWKNFITLYFQAHVTGILLYQAVAITAQRARPLVYNTNLTIEERTGNNTSNSFYSGHTSATATASFFMAKIYSDHHHLATKNKILLFSGAMLPPALVAHYRIKGGKHFRSDVLVGYMVGMLTGILVPQWHKKKNRKFSFFPTYSEQFKGFALNYKLK